MIRIYKKALSVLLSALILFPANTAVLADESPKFRSAVTLLTGLEIIGENEPDIPVTRERFADVFARTMNIYNADFVPSDPFFDTEGSEYYEAIEILHDRDFIRGVGNNNYAPGEPMRIEDIARLYVCALGLEMYSETNSTEFWTAAGRAGLLKDVSYTEGITMHNLMIMTYNLLVEAPVGKMDFSNGTRYLIDHNDNLLYEIFKVVKETGMVSENSASGVWSSSSAADGYVGIKLNNETVTALEGKTDISDRLGQTLDIYIEYGDDDNTVICYEEYKNTDVCVIDISDIDFDGSDMSAIVYTSDGMKTKRASVASFPSVIYNGVYYDGGAFDLNTLKSHDGTVTLTKSGKQNSYDIVSIAAYTDYFVSNVEYHNGEMHIFDKGINSRLLLNGDESEIKIYYANGAEASMYELQANMLLTVLRSADMKKITIYICDDTETKNITGIIAEDRYIRTKDEEEYKVSASFPMENIETGKNAKLYFDRLGNIGWMETDGDQGYAYAIVCSVRYANDDEDALMLKTFIKQGEFTNLTLAEKVNIDGISRKTVEEQLYALDEVSVKGFQTGTFPIRYILNEEGQIKTIDTPQYNKGTESKDSLRACLEKSKTTSGVLFSSDNILAKQFVLSASAKVFVIPEDSGLSGNYDMYSAGGKSLLSVGKNSNIMAFRTQEDSIYVDLVINWKDQSSYAELNHDNRLFLIDSITDVYDDVSDETVKEVRGIEGGAEKAYRTYPEFDKSLLDGLSRGDVVRFAYYKGAIYNVQVVFKKDPSGEYLGTYNQPSGANGVDNNEGNYDMYYCGYVRSRENRFLKIWTADVTGKGANILLPKTTVWSNNDDTAEEYRTIQATNIAVYDASSGGGRVYAGDIEDIPFYEGNGKYTVAIMRYRSRSPQETIIIKQ